MALATAGAQGRIKACQSPQDLQATLLVAAGVAARCPPAQQPPAQAELGSAMAVGQQAVVANAHEPLRQHVQQKSPDELLGIEAKGAESRRIAVVPVGEEDLLPLEPQEPGVGDRHPVGRPRYSTTRSALPKGGLE